MVDQLAAAIVGHCVGDFLLQVDWMASNKKNAWPKPLTDDSEPMVRFRHDGERMDATLGLLACFLHVCVYTFCVMLFTGWMFRGDWYPIAMIVAIPHYAIDRTQFVKWYMNRIGQRDFAKPPMAPWSMVAVDNAFHFVCLYLTALGLEWYWQ